MPTDRVTIMQIPFDRVTLTLALKFILKGLKKASGKPLFIATPNPEMLLAARKNPSFKKILQKTDLNIADGTGIIWASKIIRNRLPERVTGTDLMQTLCLNVGHEIRIFLLGGAPGVAEKTKDNLIHMGGCNIVGTCDATADASNDKEILALINAAKPDLLFVAFGAPKQEIWIKRNLPHLKSVKAVMGVGGAFDFIAGIRKRAPDWMRRTGLEWLFRLIQQPSRIRRIWNATVVFPTLFLFSKKSRR